MTFFRNKIVDSYNYSVSDNFLFIKNIDRYHGRAHEKLRKLHVRFELLFRCIHFKSFHGANEGNFDKFSFLSKFHFPGVFIIYFPIVLF